MPYTKYIAVWAASLLKFIGGPLAGVALHLHWLEIALCTTAGMMTSVLVVMFLGELVANLRQRYWPAKSKLFSRRTRWAVKIWQRAGIHGICALTPLLFTPIGGTILAVSFKVNRGTILFWMLTYALFWGVVLSWGISNLVGF
jgi:hypothetical protein